MVDDRCMEALHANVDSGVLCGVEADAFTEASGRFDDDVFGW